MTVTVASDVEEFLRDQIRLGVCSDASQLFNDVIRSIRGQQQRSFATTAELEAWLLEAANEPVSPLDSEDFDSLRERVRNRVSSHAQ